MLVISELYFNEKGIFVTQDNAYFKLRTFLTVKNNNCEQQSNKWDEVMYCIHEGKHSSWWKQQQKDDFALKNHNFTLYDVPKLDY